MQKLIRWSSRSRRSPNNITHPYHIHFMSLIVLCVATFLLLLVIVILFMQTQEASKRATAQAGPRSDTEKVNYNRIGSRMCFVPLLRIVDGDA